jgi:hypothetical protein
MSRTYKDKPSRLHTSMVEWKIRWDHYDHGVLPSGLFPKKRRQDELSTKHWMPTPSWWTRLMMNRPQRVRSKQWERMVVRCSIDELELQDAPIIGDRPHVYYW